MQIPLPGNGHWSKLQFGKADPQPGLPADYNGPDSVTFGGAPETQLTAETTAEHQELIEIERAINTSLETSLKVPDRLVEPLPEILAAQASLLEQEPGRPLPAMCATKNGELDIRVTRAHVGRALRFMNTLLKCMKLRKFELEFKDRYMYAVKERVRFRICFREKTKRLLPDAKGHVSDNVPTGELYFKIDGFGGGEWKDGRRLLEEQIADILVKMELRVAYLHRQWRENKILEEADEKKDQAEAEKWETEERELARVRQLLREAKRWKKAQLIREYVAHVRGAGIAKEAIDGREWGDWALAKAGWLDPGVNADDPLLRNADRDKLSIKKGGRR